MVICRLYRYERHGHQVHYRHEDLFRYKFLQVDYLFQVLLEYLPYYLLLSIGILTKTVRGPSQE
nr:MAG TPA: hypothetical protein [Caudoviricetes sp.]